MSKLTQSPAWLALQAKAEELRPQRVVELFARDEDRPARFSRDAVGLHLDFSKQKIDAETVELLLRLVDQQHLVEWRHKLFSGEIVNTTEGRAAGHMALRAPETAVMPINGVNVVPVVHAELDRLNAFAARVRSGQWSGHSGKKITDVVNIGIGGSDLGPHMACVALDSFADGPHAHFVSNVDAAQLTALLEKLDPDTTLFIVTSKTFTTQETMANAHAARRWFLRSAPESAVPKHFVAVSTSRAEVAKFGIHAENTFGFWEWVGGRYSLWSAVGLPILIAIGPERFRQFLNGARAMDEHFRTAPWISNMPVLMAMLGVWNNNFLGCTTQCIAPYSQRLVHITAWLQQLEMESNGKGVDREGHKVDYATTPALWGDVGTNGQHAFFQMLHQGPAIHAVDFILPIQAEHDLADQHQMLIANCFAQSAAMMRGKTADEVREELIGRGLKGDALEAAIPHRVFTGDRPSNTLLLSTVDPYHLGALLALYEHRTFVQSVVWNINPFDQWGVELGKQLAQHVLMAMSGKDTPLDGSTRSLLKRIS
ncbi:glucose-6-phosphate isomerase [Stenotrophobium rhamnosiphilum]|uniref:glucose-6-phosphate isomerase n=1 Tax=Stenotrophobium rhamnosiphilum TaxID=2029166 RepID=UPI0019CF91E3|nr:glucose-6-phosphate isomerase [Stenotrophobium rhamnosiphilum]